MELLNPYASASTPNNYPSKVTGLALFSSTRPENPDQLLVYLYRERFWNFSCVNLKISNGVWLVSARNNLYKS